MIEKAQRRRFGKYLRAVRARFLVQPKGRVFTPEFPASPHLYDYTAIEPSTSPCAHFGDWDSGLLLTQGFGSGVAGGVGGAANDDPPPKLPPRCISRHVSNST